MLGVLVVMASTLSLIFAKAWSTQRRANGGNSKLPAPKDWGDAEATLIKDMLRRIGTIEERVERLREDMRGIDGLREDLRQLHAKLEEMDRAASRSQD